MCRQTVPYHQNQYHKILSLIQCMNLNEYFVGWRETLKMCVCGDPETANAVIDQTVLPKDFEQERETSCTATIYFLFMTFSMLWLSIAQLIVIL